MKIRVVASLILIVVLTSLSGGCSTGGTGNLEVSISNASVLSATSSGISSVMITAKNGGVVVSAPIDYAGGQTSCSFTSVLTGAWTVEASGLDSTGKAIYYGKVSVVVEKGSSSTAGLNLKPINGEYEMSLNLAEVDSSKVSSAEVWVYPLGEGSYAKKHVITQDLAKVHVINATGMKPQSYEFQIRLFDSAGIAYYLSPWYSFDVLPASKTAIEAGLEFSQFSVNMSIDGLPARPTINSMFCVLNSSDMLEVLVSWNQPEPAELDSAIVYVRFFETTRFEEAYVYQPPTMDQTINIGFSMPSEDYHASGKAWVRVVTVGKNGLRSLSSNERQYPQM